MNAESGSDRQQRWLLVVRRSFGISDLVSNEEARRALIEAFRDDLQENGWPNPTRGMCEPLLDALLAMGASGALEDRLLAADVPQDAAYRLIDTGIAEVDPMHLVFDRRFEYPPEAVAAAQQVLDQVFQYLREHPFDD